jgi:hypothetical protein
VLKQSILELALAQAKLVEADLTDPQGEQVGRHLRGAI